MITLANQPIAGNLYAAYRPVVYFVDQTGGAAALPPALEVDVLRRGETVVSYAAGISEARTEKTRRFTLDLGRVTAPYFDRRAGLPTPGMTRPPRLLPGSIFPLSLLLAEHAASDESGLLAPTGNTLNTLTCYVIDAYRRPDDLDQTVDTYGRPRSPRFLTRRPSEVTLRIAARDTLSVVNVYRAEPGELNISYLPMLVRFTFFREDGSTITTAEVRISEGPRDFVQFPYGPADLLSIPWTSGTALDQAGLDALHHYTVQVGRLAAIQSGSFSGSGERRVVYVDRSACNPLRLHFYNSFGAWEVAEFDESAARRLDLTGSTYGRPGEVRTLSRSSRGAIEITHSTYSRAEADWLLDLANSPAIYLEENGRMLPYLLEASVLPVAYGPGSDGRQPFRATLRSTTVTTSQRAF